MAERKRRRAVRTPAQRIAFWLGWWAVAYALWVLAVFKTEPAELIAGAVAAALAATGAELVRSRGYAPFAPDLAIEVLSPDDRPGEVLAKVGDWLDAGTRLVWVVDPVRRLARIYRADGTESFVGESDALDGEDVLTGFRRLLADVLAI